MEYVVTGSVLLSFAILPAVVGASIHLKVSHKPRVPGRTQEVFLVWFLGWTVGIGGVIGFMEHWLSPVQTAELIGWKNSPFQYEVAIANLVPGVLGLLCLRYRDRWFWLATIIAESIWYLGDAAGHVWQWTARGNTAQGNIGGPFWGDVLTPVILILLYRSWRSARESSETAEMEEMED